MFKLKCTVAYIRLRHRLGFKPTQDEQVALLQYTTVSAQHRMLKLTAKRNKVAIRQQQKTLKMLRDLDK